MEFGPYQLQTFVSLTVVLGVAFVALICDYLKRNNEQLRELVIELKVRSEEDQKRTVKMAPRAPAAPAVVPEAAGQGQKTVEAPEAPPAPALAARAAFRSESRGRESRGDEKRN